MIPIEPSVAASSTTAIAGNLIPHKNLNRKLAFCRQVEGSLGGIYEVQIGLRTSLQSRGNRHLRTLFIQGARAILLRPASWAKHSFGSWLTAAARRMHRNVLSVALANKLARIAWTVLAQGRRYEARVEPLVA